MKFDFTKILGKRLTIALRDLRVNVRRLMIHSHANIVTALHVTDIISSILSLLCLAALIVYIGFDHNPHSKAMLLRGLRCVQWFFALSIIAHLTLNFKSWRRENRIFKWVVDFMMLVTLLPTIYPHPDHPWIPWLEQLLYSRKFLFIILGAYSLVDLSYGLTRAMSRRLNPSLLLALSFLFFIFIGSLLLMMPKSTVSGISYVDALFVSTSAVSITGLSTVDVAATFTPLGNLILACMVQIGGIGVITFTSFFAIFYSGNQSIHSQLMIRDMVYSKSMNELGPTLLYIIMFTLSIEVIGAVFVYFTIPDTMNMVFEDRVAFAAFHSLSSFCNAGFSIIPEGMANPALMHSDMSIYIVTSVLVFAGAIGYPLLVNLKDIFFNYIQRLWRWILRLPSRPRPIHIYDLNTKLVFITTTAILIVSSVVFYIIESDNSMAGMTTGQRIIQSVFNSLTPRSAGFVSINPATFANVTFLLIVLQMWIGGSSQSMAGGVKVNTLAVLLLNLRSIIRGDNGVRALNRQIAIPSVRRANAVVTLSWVSTAILTIAVLACEPDLTLKQVAFESISALFTVGSSLGVTDQLCTASKLMLSVAMFVGRVGLLSLLNGMFTGGRDTSTLYPQENVIIS
jgi:Trk-type K+ transport system membrane component